MSKITNILSELKENKGVKNNLNEDKGDLKAAAEAYAKEVGGEATLNSGHNCYNIIRDGQIVAQVYLEDDYDDKEYDGSSYVYVGGGKGSYERVTTKKTRRDLNGNKVLIKSVSNVEYKPTDVAEWNLGGVENYASDESNKLYSYVKDHINELPKLTDGDSKVDWSVKKLGDKVIISAPKDALDFEPENLPTEKSVKKFLSGYSGAYDLDIDDDLIFSIAITPDLA